MNTKKHLSSSQVIIFGFTGAVLLGALLLMLPFSSVDGEKTTFLGALFTAVSSVCVTGLVVYDTATHWSMFGQIVILLLIQMGGLGVVTTAAAITMIAGRKIGLMQRSTLQESISAPKVGGIVKLTVFILKITFIIEFLGAALLFPIFYRDFGLRGIWLAIFHSISAFCNAGFDLMGSVSHFSSLTSYHSEPLVNAVIMLLIIVGGIGFLVWEDIGTNKWHIKKYRMQSKIVLLTTAILLIAPTLYFYFCEFAGYSAKERFLLSAFQAVTPRTAGFNTYDLTSLSSVGQTVTILLMLIGGSPGSTAGGMKTTTVAVLVLSAISVFRKKDNIECFDRRILDSVVKNAAAIFLTYVLIFVVSGIVISMYEKLPLSKCLFETASAVGTVGLTLGITPLLHGFSKVILISLMFFGRVGALTVIFAAVSRTNKNISKKPQEHITVG